MEVDVADGRMTSARPDGSVSPYGGANVGQLTPLREQLQPINFMPRFSGIPVNVRPV